MKLRFIIQRSNPFGIGIFLRSGYNQFGDGIFGININIFWWEIYIGIEYFPRF